MFDGLMMHLKKLSKRVCMTYGYFRSFGAPRFCFTDENLLKVVIKRAIVGRKATFTTSALEADEICERILSDLNLQGSKSILEILEDSSSSIIADALHRFCLITSQAALFEIKFKFTASNMGIETFRFQNAERAEYRNISRIAEDFSQRCPRIAIDLKFLADIRNCLNHGNFLQLKNLVEPYLTPEQARDCRGTVVVLNLSLTQAGAEPVVIDDLEDTEIARRFGPFVWFLNQTNSYFLNYVSLFVERGLQAIDDIGLFHGLCFNETLPYFDQVVSEGRRLNEDQKANFLRLRGTYLGSNPSNRLNEMLGRFNYVE